MERPSKSVPQQSNSGAFSGSSLVSYGNRPKSTPNPGISSRILSSTTANRNTFEAQPTELHGVGIGFQQDQDGALRVSRLAENGPAYACGMINLGDIILSVGGVDVYKQSFEVVTSFILGPRNTSVQLGFRRENAELGVAAQNYTVMLDRGLSIKGDFFNNNHGISLLGIRSGSNTRGTTPRYPGSANTSVIDDSSNHPKDQRKITPRQELETLQQAKRSLESTVKQNNDIRRPVTMPDTKTPHSAFGVLWEKLSPKEIHSDNVSVTSLHQLQGMDNPAPNKTPKAMRAKSDALIRNQFVDEGDARQRVEEEHRDVDERGGERRQSRRNRDSSGGGGGGNRDDRERRRDEGDRRRDIDERKRESDDRRRDMGDRRRDPDDRKRESDDRRRDPDDRRRESDDRRRDPDDRRRESDDRRKDRRSSRRQQQDGENDDNNAMNYEAGPPVDEDESYADANPNPRGDYGISPLTGERRSRPKRSKNRGTERGMPLGMAMVEGDVVDVEPSANNDRNRDDNANVNDINVNDEEEEDADGYPGPGNGDQILKMSPSGSVDELEANRDVRNENNNYDDDYINNNNGNTARPTSQGKQLHEYQEKHRKAQGATTNKSNPTTTTINSNSNNNNNNIINSNTWSQRMVRQHLPQQSEVPVHWKPLSAVDLWVKDTDIPAILGSTQSTMEMQEEDRRRSVKRLLSSRKPREPSTIVLQPDDGKCWNSDELFIAIEKSKASKKQQQIQSQLGIALKVQNGKWSIDNNGNSPLNPMFNSGVSKKKMTLEDAIARLNASSHTLTTTTKDPSSSAADEFVPREDKGWKTMLASCCPSLQVWI